MIQLTPLEEATAVKELLQIRENEAMLIGEKKGFLVGQIMMLLHILKQKFTLREFLLTQNNDELQKILDTLESKIQ